MSFFDNTRKPVGRGGKIMVVLMNIGHSFVARWGLKYLKVEPNATILDCGCGGGANIKSLLKRCPKGVVKGLDYSPLCVQSSRKLNRKAIEEGRCMVKECSVLNISFSASQFDIVTAFETVYFWPGLLPCFKEVYRVLKPNGIFFICNESNGDTDKDEYWVKKIDGMTIYKDIELKAVLEKAGFVDIDVHKTKGGWLCIIAKKVGG